MLKTQNTSVEWTLGLNTVQSSGLTSASSTYILMVIFKLQLKPGPTLIVFSSPTKTCPRHIKRAALITFQLFSPATPHMLKDFYGP